MAQRTFSVFGDSISTFEGVTSPSNRIYYEGELRRKTGVLEPGDTWWARVIERFGGRLVSNAAFSGSMVDGAGFPAGRSHERVAEIVGPGGEEPDDVLVFIGINDYGWGGARAQAAGRSAAMPRCAEALAVPAGEPGPATEDSLPSFSRAYGAMLSLMREMCPSARIWCLTLLPGRELGAVRPGFAYRLRGVDLDDYNDAIRAAAAANGCRVADVRAAGFDYEAIDGTHPTRRGMEQLAALVVATMEAAENPRGAAGAGETGDAAGAQGATGAGIAAGVQGMTGAGHVRGSQRAGAGDARGAGVGDAQDTRGVAGAAGVQGMTGSGYVRDATDAGADDARGAQDADAGDAWGLRGMTGAGDAWGAAGVDDDRGKRTAMSPQGADVAYGAMGFDQFGVRDAGWNVSRETFAGLSADLFPEDMRSGRRCVRKSCFGCEFVRGTGSMWSCVCDLP